VEVVAGATVEAAAAAPSSVTRPRSTICSTSSAVLEVLETERMPLAKTAKSLSPYDAKPSKTEVGGRPIREVFMRYIAVLCLLSACTSDGSGRDRIDVTPADSALCQILQAATPDPVQAAPNTGSNLFIASTHEFGKTILLNGDAPPYSGYVIHESPEFGSYSFGTDAVVEIRVDSTGEVGTSSQAAGCDELEQRTELTTTDTIEFLYFESVVPEFLLSSVFTADFAE
jgi:hypothetical protein